MSLDLAKLDAAITRLSTVAPSSSCEGCIALRKELAPILQSLVHYASQSEAGLDEVRVDHREHTTFMLSQGTDMEARHARFKTGKSTVPASLQALMEGRS